MRVTNNYDRINASFERAVTKMQESLQYLVDNDKVSERFITTQNLIIKSLIDYQQQTEKYISTLEMENVELSLDRIKQFEKFKHTIQAFEAVCFIHGINDFPIWMNKGINCLVHEVIQQHKENVIILPSSLKEWINKLPDQEKEAIQTILFGNSST